MASQLTVKSRTGLTPSHRRVSALAASQTPDPKPKTQRRWAAPLPSRLSWGITSQVRRTPHTMGPAPSLSGQQQLLFCSSLSGPPVSHTRPSAPPVGVSAPWCLLKCSFLSETLLAALLCSGALPLLSQDAPSPFFAVPHSLYHHLTCNVFSYLLSLSPS